jgi:photosystem II stability/assembly factor-like uncharacterized protein
MKKYFLILFLMLFTNVLFPQWFPQYSGTNSFLSKVRMLDANTGFVIGDSSHILKTTNGGLNWIKLLTGTSHDDYFTGIHFVNANTGYVCGGYMNGMGTSKILKTTNSGLNWQTLYQEPNKFYFATCFINAQTGFVGGYDGIYYKTTDGGTNWTQKQVTGVAIWTIAFVNQNTGFIAGQQGMLRRTTDCGETYTLISTGSSARIASLFFTDEMHGYAVCDSEVVMRTTNSGLNWSWQKLGTVFGYEAVHFVNQNTGYAVANWWDVASYKLIKTTNAGVNWFTLAQGQGDPYFDIFFANEYTGWITGYNGLILKTTNGGSTFVSNENSLVENFTLYQNYPNPFNPTTTIKIVVEKTENIKQKTVKKLVIYDLLGKEVAILLNEALQPGSYEVTFDGSGLAGGVYFYQLRVGDFTETRKMILVK